MKNNKELENILDECLERILEGESVEACLSWYPEHADELRPLLQTAVDARQAVDIRPRREFRDRAGYDFQRVVREMGTVRRGGFFQAIMKPAWTTIMIVIIVLAAGSGTVVAANNSLPGESLYSVKMATESVRLAFAFSDEAKADLYVKLADRRVEEIIEMAEKGDAVQINNATDKLEEHLLAMSSLDFIGGADALERQIARLDTAVAHEDTFGAESAPLTAPEPTQPPTVTAPQEGTDITPGEMVKPPAAAGAAPTPEVDEESDWKAVQIEPAVAEGVEGELKMAVANSAVLNSIALNSLLENADEDVRNALNRAIEIINAGYNNILSNID